jgi:hypothetical protein
MEILEEIDQTRLNSKIIDSLKEIKLELESELNDICFDCNDSGYSYCEAKGYEKAIQKSILIINQKIKNLENE